MSKKISSNGGVLLIFLLLFVACKQKKVISLAGDEPVPVADFVAFFQPLSLTYIVGDTILERKEKDSLVISSKNFKQFVPDSVLNGLVGKNTKHKLYALGKVVEENAESYLIVKYVAQDKKALLLLAFDNKNEYITAMPAMIPDKNKLTDQLFSIDRRFTITKTIQRKNSDATISEGKEVYILNVAAHDFKLIMTDALEDKRTELINPIDTLKRDNKYSADYGTGKMNLVSIRDGRKKDRMTFYIHFEKNDGECTGELKGEAKWITSTKAEYRQDGDACVLQFVFSAKAVTLKEENCGSRRGLHCTFDGSFSKKKYTKPTVATPKKKKTK